MLLNLFTHPEEARAVGHVYLGLRPGEREIGLLMSKIFQGPNVPGTDTLLRSYLDMRKRTDFEKGDTVTLDGWFLSQTEARVYGVVALAGKDPA